jgi:peptidoglycan-associated lipoprotein
LLMQGSKSNHAEHNDVTAAWPDRKGAPAGFTALAEIRRRQIWQRVAAHRDLFRPISATLSQDPEMGSGADKKGTQMQKLKTAILTSAMVAAAISLGGCATREYVDQHVAVVDAKTQATQSQVDRHTTQLAQLDQSTKEALDRATAAGKLAEGKFLYTMVLSDDSVKFKAASAKLSPEAQQRLTEFAEKLKTDNRNVYLEIQGHTDGRGPEAVNQRLGEERAEAVRVFMNRHGVPLNRMSAISYGKEDPATTNKTRVGRAQNRRVVLVVMS